MDARMVEGVDAVLGRGRGRDLGLGRGRGRGLGLGLENNLVVTILQKDGSSARECKAVETSFTLKFGLGAAAVEISIKLRSTSSSGIGLGSGLGPASFCDVLALARWSTIKEATRSHGTAPLNMLTLEMNFCQV
jgi:hypothetical protein